VTETHTGKMCKIIEDNTGRGLKVGEKYLSSKNVASKKNYSAWSYQFLQVVANFIVFKCSKNVSAKIGYLEYRMSLKFLLGIGPMLVKT
jgi:hypothetical protein